MAAGGWRSSVRPYPNPSTLFFSRKSQPPVKLGRESPIAACSLGPVVGQQRFGVDGYATAINGDAAEFTRR